MASAACLDVFVCSSPFSGHLHRRAVISVELSNVQRTTVLVHWQEDFFSLRLQVVKPASPDESIAGL